jgi:ribonuclease HI
MCYGWLISRESRVLAQGHGAFARTVQANSNIAEYLALIEGLDALLALNVGDEFVQVFGDAKSIIDQMRGAAEVNAVAVRPLYRRARRLADYLPSVSWNWLPRKYNRQADQLSRRAMRQLRLDHGYYQATVMEMTSGHRSGLSKTNLMPVIDLRIYAPVKG